MQLPNNLFYNTGITTYIWLLSNKKTEERKGKVLLIDASEAYRKLCKNLGNKNCEFTPDHINEILEVYSEMKTLERDSHVSSNGSSHSIVSKVFDNADFGYYKVNIERPKRLKTQFTDKRIESLRYVTPMSRGSFSLDSNERTNGNYVMMTFNAGSGSADHAVVVTGYENRNGSLFIKYFDPTTGSTGIKSASSSHFYEVQ